MPISISIHFHASSRCYLINNDYNVATSVPWLGMKSTLTMARMRLVWLIQGKSVQNARPIFRHYLCTQVKYDEFENLVVTEEIITCTYRNDTNRPIRATDHQQCRCFVEWLPPDSPTMRPPNFPLTTKVKNGGRGRGKFWLRGYSRFLSLFSHFLVLSISNILDCVIVLLAA